MSLLRELLRRSAMQVPQVRSLYQSRNLLLGERVELLRELERIKKNERGSPFYHYHSNIDLEEIIRRHAVGNISPRPGYLVNFLGVLIDPRYFPEILQDRAGTVEGAPIPANWHADIAEWGAALRAVDLARDSFTVIELGCGWGCWLNNTGVAARRAGLDVHLIGVEGDEGHLGFAREACAANGFAAEQLELHHGIATATSGFALFPRQERAGVQWGLEPVFGATEEQRKAAAASGKYDELPMVAMDDLAVRHKRIDLLHVDIQGGEADLIAGSLAALCAKVAYLLVGTHSRQIEGRIMQILLDAGWVLEVERPAILIMHEPTPIVYVDGVQGWRNPTLSSVS